MIRTLQIKKKKTEETKKRDLPIIGEFEYSRRAEELWTIKWHPELKKHGL